MYQATGGTSAVLGRRLATLGVGLLALASIATATAQSPVPSSPVAAGTPTATSTPARLPAPSGLAVDVSGEITRADGTFIPPAERTATVYVRWNAIAGFGGSFDVERLLVQTGSSNAFAHVSNVAASSGQGGKIEYSEQVPFLETASIQRCYRVRAVTGAEASSFSARACTQLPPASGGGDALPADPFAGLSPGVLAAARAVDSGDAATVAALVPASGAIRTSYPGDGSRLDRGTAVDAITAAIVNNPAASDAIGGGGYRLIAIWIPSVQPDHVMLVGSGIDSSGTRITTVFSLPRDGSVLLAYGRAGNTASVLDQFAGQGDLRRIPEGTHPPAATPGAPVVGSGTRHGARDSNRFVDYGLAVFAGSLGLAGIALVRRRRS